MFRGVPPYKGMFRGVPEVFRECSGPVLGCSWFYIHPSNSLFEVFYITPFLMQLLVLHWLLLIKMELSVTKTFQNALILLELLSNPIINFKFETHGKLICVYSMCIGVSCGAEKEINFLLFTAGKEVSLPRWNRMDSHMTWLYQFLYIVKTTCQCLRI